MAVLDCYELIQTVMRQPHVYGFSGPSSLQTEARLPVDLEQVSVERGFAGALFHNDTMLSSRGQDILAEEASILLRAFLLENAT